MERFDWLGLLTFAVPTFASLTVAVPTFAVFLIKHSQVQSITFAMFTTALHCSSDTVQGFSVCAFAKMASATPMKAMKAMKAVAAMKKAVPMKAMKAANKDHL